MPSSKETSKTSKRQTQEEEKPKKLDKKVKLEKEIKKATKPEKETTKASKPEKESKKSVDKKSKEVEKLKTTESTDQLRFDEDYAELYEQVKLLKEGLQTVIKTLKKLESSHNHDIKKTKKSKQKRNGPHKPTGFAKPQKVPEKLAKFIKVTPGSELTGPALTSKVWDQLKQRELFYEKDKRVFRTNKEVSDLFGVNKSVNSSTDHKDKEGFNFCNLQSYIKNALNKK